MYVSNSLYQNLQITQLTVLISLVGRREELHNSLFIDSYGEKLTPEFARY